MSTSANHFQVDEREDGDSYCLGGPSGLDEEDERDAWLLRIELCALKALEQRAMCREEAGILKVGQRVF